MTTRELAQKLLTMPDIEVGFFDGEGHWCMATDAVQTQVDQADWRPRLGESQTGTMRDVIEVSDYR